MDQFTPKQVSKDIIKQFLYHFRRRSRRKWQKQNIDQSAEKTPLFIIGAQRSGTTMLGTLLDESPYITQFHEVIIGPAYRHYRLNKPKQIKRLIKNSPGQSVVFKPVCDSHLGDKILDEYAHAKAVWMYRHYYDVANSAVKRWEGHQKDIIRKIIAGEYDVLGWRGERISDEMMATLKRLFSEDLSDHEGAVLQWILRNDFFFRLNLADDPRVLLMSYEQLVKDPKSILPIVFDFCDLPYPGDLADQVRTSSINKNPSFDVRPEIKTLADDMWQNLETTYKQQSKLANAQV